MIQIISLVLPVALGVCDDPYIRSRADMSICPTASSAHCLYWRAGAVTYNQSQTGNPNNPNGSDTVFAPVSKALASWQSIMDSCGNLTLQEGPHVAERNIGYDSTSQSNVNVILFRTRKCTADIAPASDPCHAAKDCNNKYDCWDSGDNVIALTTTTYDTRTGRILDADVEFNAAQFKFTTLDSPACPRFAPNYNCVATDVQNTATHELGHSLGLDHTMWRDPSTGQNSTMSPSANVGDLDKRVIDSGSRQFICTTYPKGSASRDCIASTDQSSSSGCSTTPGAPLVVAAVAWLAGLRRSRRRSRD